MADQFPNSTTLRNMSTNEAVPDRGGGPPCAVMAHVAPCAGKNRTLRVYHTMGFRI